MSAQDILLSPEEHAELSRRTRSATIRQRDGRRARVILLAAQGCSRVEIARLVGFSLRSVTLWCQRFQERGLDGLIDKGVYAGIPENSVGKHHESGSRLLLLS
ncbi:helix-turn-helix domain-containing protein, partial [Pseudomonas syringae group genomosp. 3]|uniref:helix-turn-helix domain-containing protein n=1 Tax=Pseudomonas syringae group genomosp. 3 TaxID=251701 RepID=UPI00217EAA78